MSRNPGTKFRRAIGLLGLTFKALGRTFPLAEVNGASKLGSGFVASQCPPQTRSASSPSETPKRLERWLEKAIVAAMVSEVFNERSRA